MTKVRDVFSTTISAIYGIPIIALTTPSCTIFEPFEGSRHTYWKIVKDAAESRTGNDRNDGYGFPVSG